MAPRAELGLGPEMNATAVRATVVRGMAGMAADRMVLGVFAATLFLSAALLFSVQPVFAKLVLPTLGGSPSVWAVAMCFFQATLLGGYCYAHLLNRHFGPRQALLCHLVLLAAALATLPFGLPAGAGAPPPDGAYLWLVGVLTLGVGLPFFAVAANAPLLQAWFARTGHPDAADPYFLYGASNLGSLLALLAYPVLLEPLLGLRDQSAAWTGGFAVLTAAILACGVLLIARRRADRGPAALSATDARRPLAWSTRLHWLALAMVPSGLLVAYTTHLTTDLASAPFLWVIPLAVFLATFIAVFRERPLIPESWSLALQPLAVAVAGLGLVAPGTTDAAWALHMAAGFAAFLTTTLVCHRALYLRRPESARLTEFYLWMSLGGVLGGILAAIAAPQLFDSVLEYPLLLVAGLLLRPGVAQAFRDRSERTAGLRLGGSLGLAGIAVVALYAAEVLSFAKAERLLAATVLVAGLATLAHLRRPARLAGAALALGLTLTALSPNLAEGFSVRSFFGVHRVIETPDGKFRLLGHGTTVHGAQRLLDDAGAPVSAPDPATYYYPGGPLARAVAAARVAADGGDRSLQFGVVGLGAGSLLCYAEPGESWRFFEIDAVVERIARNPAHFSFMSRCGPETPVVIGDARLTLQNEPIFGYDFLLIDAFSSDVVPVHLLTQEALELYLSRLAPSGVLALHISNRHMDLEAVVAATATTVPGARAYVVSDQAGRGGFDGMRSQVVFIAKSEAALDAVRQWPDARPAQPAGVRPWTDDYSDVLGAIRRKYAK